MDLNIEQHVPQDFSDESRVWIYQSSRPFLISEAFQLEDIFKDFLQNWNSHGRPVKGYANLFFGRFIVLMADETATMVGGCSTDSSVRMIKDIESRFKTDMFDRQALAFIVKDKIELIPLSQFNYAFDNHFIDENTLYFNNTVLIKKDLIAKWLLPLKDSWLNRHLVQRN